MHITAYLFGCEESRITRSDSSRQWAGIPPMAPITLLGQSAPASADKPLLHGEFFERARSVFNLMRMGSDALVNQPGE